MLAVRPTIEREDLLGSAYKRLTMVIRDKAIEHVFFPIFPPNEHARDVLSWLREHPSE